MPTPAKQQCTGKQMTEAGYEERRNSFHGIANRQVSGSPNNVNACEGNNDHKLVIALHLRCICLAARNHSHLNLITTLTTISVTLYYDDWELHPRRDTRTCQRG